MNLFIESIEGGTYVAGIGNQSIEQVLRDEYRDSNNFKSLSEIKEQLSGQQFDKVYLKQNTPYDEMCGSYDSNQKLLLELEWR